VSRVFVTGVTSFIGSHLAKTMAARGHEVSGSTSTEDGMRSPTEGVKKKIRMVLGEPIDAIAHPVDSVVHCAWDLRPGAGETNLRGTQLIADAFRAAGVSHQIFISSCSAHSAAVTEYGITKLKMQQYMVEQGYAAARLGITVGAGGIFRRMSDALTTRPIVPLIDGGRNRVPIVAIDDLCEALAAIVELQLAGMFNLFNPDLVPLAEVLQQTRAASNGRALLLPVPWWVVMPPLWVARRLGVSLPLDIDNVRAMRANETRYEPSDLQMFVRQPMTLAQMVRRAAAVPT
jgi:nucleoside-diphosphate-sugar epimerase